MARRWKKRRQLEAELRALFAQPLEPAELRRQVELLASERHFRNLLALWGPELYSRQRILFRPFILDRFSSWAITRWKGKDAEALDRWLAETEAHDDTALFGFLYRRKLELQAWTLAGRRRLWQRDLLDRLRRAGSAEERDRILRRCDLHLPIDQETAVALYHLDPTAASVFILGHWPGRVDRLMELARQASDQGFYFALYRQTVSSPHWFADIVRLCETVSDPQKLNEELEKRHSAVHGLTFGQVFQLLRRRRQEVLPYIHRHFGSLRSDWPVSRYYSLRKFVLEKGWLDLWAGLVGRYGWSAEFERSITELIEDQITPEEQIRQRLLLLGGIPSDPFQPIVVPVHTFSDRLAVRLYRRFPDLLRGPLRARLRWGGADVYAWLTAVTLEAGDEELWGWLVRSGSRRWRYEKALLQIIKDPTLDDATMMRRLGQLAGVSGEWNRGPFGVMLVRQLSEPVAVALYRRQPALLRGVFRKHISAGYGFVYPQLTIAALEAEDAELLDYLASRFLTRAWLSWLVAGPMKGVIEKLAAHYESLLDRPEEFVRRAVAVLGQVPAHVIGNQSYNKLIRDNRLARLLFERSASVYLDYPQLLRDLLEAPAIHVQVLALKALGLDDSRVRPIAADNLDLLLPTLLRTLHRRTRLLAFRALLNAATTEDNARLILDRARQALDLPEQHYPHAALIGLIGQLLQRWPGLRGPREQPRIFVEKMS